MLLHTITNNTLVIGDVKSSILVPLISLLIIFLQYVFSTSINNPKLEPIITRETEVGMELRLFKNRLGVDATYYEKKTGGQIFAVPIAPSTGSLTLVSNLGLVRNTGIELALDAKPIDKKDLSWNVVIYFYKKPYNKVLELSSGLNKVILNTATEIELDAFPGHSVTDIYATVPRYDPDGHIIVSATGVPVPAADKANFGTTQHDFTMGLVNNVRFKDFTLDFPLITEKVVSCIQETADLQLLYWKCMDDYL
jgi:hypothetical protein